MCGIAGYYNADVSLETVDMIASSLNHRGPDDKGFYAGQSVGLIHTRLSILELSPLGSQPYEYQNLVLVYNGEIYNFKEVRSELRNQGYSFNSNSDTEVLIKSFHLWGPKCVDHFVGMFAFCIYNKLTHEIFLFRDRVGVKPLYYSYQNGVMFFASELKSLLHFPVSRQINQEAVSFYFRFGFVPGSLSIFKHISKVSPGQYIRIKNSEFQLMTYWKLEPISEVFDKTEDDWVDELEEQLISAFKFRMVSDVPVGVFLSGGIDSSLLCAILQKHHGNINTFTVGFGEKRFDESDFARRISELLNTRHVSEVLRLDQARQLLGDFYSMYDEPFADTSGIPTSFVATIAKKHGMKVVLSADGGDELFGGYPHYLRAANFLRKIDALPQRGKQFLSQIIRIGFPINKRKQISLLNLEHKAFALEELLEAKSLIQFYESFIANQTHQEVSNLLNFDPPGKLNLAVDQNEFVKTMMAWDFKYFLPDDLLVKIDRSTMFHSLECREPFLDHRLVEFANKVPSTLKYRDGQGKYILRKLLSRYVPKDLFNRKKQGFSIPIFDWFRKDLDMMFLAYLSNDNLKKINILNSEEVLRELDKYIYYKKRGKEYNIEKMWRILSFVMWWEKYMLDEEEKHPFHYS